MAMPHEVMVQSAKPLSEGGRVRRRIKYSGCVPTERRSYFADEWKLLIFWEVILDGGIV